MATWARDHGVVGTGVDTSRRFSEQAKRRADDHGVAGTIVLLARSLRAGGIVRVGER